MARSRATHGTRSAPPPRRRLLHTAGLLAGSFAAGFVVVSLSGQRHRV